MPKGSKRPAISPENRENQLIGLAIDAAEEQLRNGTASSQVITHFLKLGTARERLEREILEKQKELITAKTEQIASQKEIKELYEEALKAMKRYSGQDDGNDH